MKNIIRKWLEIDEDIDLLLSEINRLTVPKFKVGEMLNVYEFYGVFLERKDKIGTGKVVSVSECKYKNGIKYFKYHLIDGDTFYDGVSEYKLELKS